MKRQPNKTKTSFASRTTTVNSQPSAPFATSYDRDSGVVYNEVEVSGRALISWIIDYKTPSIVRTRRRPNEEGARTLADMVLFKLGVQSQDLTVESLQTLPWIFGQRIWQRIVEDHAESFYIWRTFAAAYGTEFAGSDKRYMLNIKSLSLPLIEYYKGIDSVGRHWLTSLRISPKQISVPDLVAISTITNLTVLDLSDGQLYIDNRASTLDSRVLRSWMEQARAGRAFQSLRVFMMGWQENIDTWVFDLLDAFPRLNILVLTDCRWLSHKNHKEWEEEAWKHGWSFLPSKRGTKHLRALVDDRSFYVGNASSMYYESIRLLSETTPNAGKQYQSRPLLECWLGTPRPWNHVIDEFPGTRTVYLERIPTIESVMVPSKLSTNNPASSKRGPSSPGTLSGTKFPQRATRQKISKHSAASLLAELS